MVIPYNYNDNGKMPNESPFKITIDDLRDFYFIKYFQINKVLKTLPEWPQGGAEDELIMDLEIINQLEVEYLNFLNNMIIRQIWG